jgi:hypothetical protein
LKRNEGITSASRTTPLGTVGPTRSKAAYIRLIHTNTTLRTITYSMLFMRPNMKNAVAVRKLLDVTTLRT